MYQAEILRLAINHPHFYIDSPGIHLQGHHMKKLHVEEIDKKRMIQSLFLAIVKFPNQLWCDAKRKQRNTPSVRVQHQGISLCTFGRLCVSYISFSSC